jgi:hypothetical protein
LTIGPKDKPMRLSRPRFTVRRLLVAVAIIGVMMSYVRTRERWTTLRGRASYHARLEDFYRASIDDPSGWLKLRPELEKDDPEPPPISPYGPEALEPGNCKLLMEYHARMRSYWESRW